MRRWLVSESSALIGMEAAMIVIKKLYVTIDFMDSKGKKSRVIDGEYLNRTGNINRTDAAKYEKYLESRKTEYNKVSKRAYADRIRGRSLSNNDINWLDILRRVGGLRGEACASLAEMLFNKGHVENAVNGVKLSDDLLSGMSEGALESVTVLIRDGWSGSIGELLSCARSL